MTTQSTTKTTTAGTTRTSYRPADKRRRKVRHLVHVESNDAAYSMGGVQVRAFCGVWVSSFNPAEAVTVASHGLEKNQCKNCVRVLYSMLAR